MSSSTTAERVAKPGPSKALMSFSKFIPYLIVLTTIIGAASFYVLSQLPPVYRSEASVLLGGDADGRSRPATGSGNAFVVAQAQLARSPELARRVLDRLGLATAPANGNVMTSGSWLGDLLARVGFDSEPRNASGEVKQLDRYFRNLDVALELTPPTIFIGFSSTDPQRAADLANAIAAEFIALQHDARAAGELPATVRMDSRAVAAPTPAFPRVVPTTAVISGTVFALGMLMFLLTALFRRRFPPRDAFAEPMPIVPDAVPVEGRIRWMGGRRESRMTSREPTWARPGAPEFQPSLSRIADQIGQAENRRVLVTSADPGSVDTGQSHAAVALARALASHDRRVVLIDLNIDRDGTAMLGSGQHPLGITDLLTGDACFAQAISRDRESRAHIIPMGRHVLSAALFGDERLATILDALDHTYDHLILDGRSDLIEVIGCRIDAAMIATPFGAADPRTVRAFDQVAAIAPSPILFLAVGPGRSDEERRVTPKAGVAA